MDFNELSVTIRSELKKAQWLKMLGTTVKVKKKGNLGKDFFYQWFLFSTQCTWIYEVLDYWPGRILKCDNKGQFYSILPPTFENIYLEKGFVESPGSFIPNVFVFLPVNFFCKTTFWWANLVLPLNNTLALKCIGSKMCWL